MRSRDSFSLSGSDVRKQLGFTLIELLVGITVGILLIVILFQIFNVAAGAWQRSENQVDAYREARAALQLITRDLSSVAIQFPTNPASSPAPSPTDGGIAPTLVLDKYPNPDPKPDPLDANNEEVYFLTTVSNTGSSSLCAVGYFCQWLPDVPPLSDPKGTRTPRAYSLFRQFLGSGINTEIVSPAQYGVYDLLKKTTTTPLDFMDIFARSRPNGASPGNSASSITATPVELSSYIWDLQFRVDTNLQAIRGGAQPPNDHGDLSASAVQRQYTSKSGAKHPLELPPYIEVRFKALSAAGTRQLEGNLGVDRNTWWDGTSALYQRVIRPSTQQFVVRVPLQAYTAGRVPSNL